jgi:AhpD family alkylhydroperoxidase
MAARESQLAGNVRRDIKEAVAAAVSKINQCPYCVDAHTIMLKATGVHKTAWAIATGKYDQIQDSKVRAIVKWALATRLPGSNSLQSPPFSEEEAPEIVGTAVFYHYINRMVSALLSETPLPSNRPWLKRPLKRLATLIFSRAIRRSISAGESLKFLSEATLPDDLAWGKTVPTVAGAYARFSAVVDDVGAYGLSAEVRARVQDHVQDWKGEDFGISRSWVEQKLRGLNEASRVAGHLTLLTAFAPYQVDDQAVLAFQTHYPENEKLLGALAWASFTAARKIGTWLQASK